MSSKKFKDLSIIEPIKSPYDLDEIRQRLSGTITINNGYFRGDVIAYFELFLTLANEIHELKEKVKQLEKRNE